MSLFKYDGSVAAETNTAVRNFYGTDAKDSLVGGAAAESFWGGQGDLMTGGGGDDTYYLKSPLDRAIEMAGGGVDKIVSWTSVYLPNHPNIENLQVEGDKTYGAGDGRDNIIQGGAGAQQLYGGGGQDVLVGGAGSDTFIVIKGEGNDVVQDFKPGEDVIRLTSGFTSFAQVQTRLTQVGADVRLDMANGDGLVIRQVKVADLSVRDFQLQLDTSRLGAMTFHDEFNKPLSLWDAQSNPSGLWRPDYGYQGEQGAGSYTLATNDEKQIYTSPYFRGHAGDFSESPFVSNNDGTLSIIARPSTSTEIYGYQYTSGLITTQPTFSQTYGYFEMRADLPDAAGAWPAFWMLPADGSWPPELDIMETLTFDSRSSWSTEHSGLNGVHTSNGQAAFVPDTASGFHTYGVLWTASDLTWFVDGVQVFRTATPADMNKPMFMLANMAVGGWGGAIDKSALPAEMRIDYIRAYSLAGGAGAPAGPVAPTAPAPTTPAPATSNPTAPAPPVAPVPASGEGLVLKSTTYGETLTGGAGRDTLSAGQGPDKLTGGAGADTFQFTKLPWNAGHVTDFNVGVDKLDISGLFAPGYSGADPVADGYLRFESDGAGGTRVMLDIDGPASANPWSFVITTLDNVAPSLLTAAKVLGTPGEHVAVVDAASAAQSAPVAEGQVLTAAHAGDRLVGGAGADTLNASQGADALTGGGGPDTFAFAKLPWNAGHVTDFTVGVDRLDLSSLIKLSGYTGSDPLADGYLIIRTDAAGFAQVCWDIDGKGAGNPWPITLTTLDNVRPGDLTAAKLMNPTPALSAPVGILVKSAAYGDRLEGGAGADTLTAGQGPDVLVGGAGADHFVFAATPWNAGQVIDFVPGADRLDLRPIFATMGYAGADPIAEGYLRLDADGVGGTRVYVDVDGPHGAQWPFLISTLQNVAPTTLHASDWLV